jgi:TRAP-type C4-dicarboxylate transport system permease small subunit
LGAVLCTKKGSHATVTALSDFFTPGVKKIVQVFIQIVILFVAYVMIQYGISMTYLTKNQLSAAMEISMALVNVSVPFCGSMILIHALIHLVELLFFKKTTPESDA